MNFSSFSHVDQVFTSSSCNRTPNSVHWGINDDIVYGSCNSLVVVKPGGKDGMHVVATINSHSDRVNCVRWIPSSTPSESKTIISGGVDKRFNVYKYQASSKQITLSRTYSDATSSVECCTGLTLTDGSLLLVSSSGDSTVRVYNCMDDSSQAQQCIRFGSGFILAIDISTLPETTTPVLACCGDDMKIHLLTRQNSQFMQAMSLQGHEDWIRGVEFATDDNKDLLLASSAQDCFVRVWRITKRETTNESALIKEYDELKVKERLFTVGCQDDNISAAAYSVTIETVLYGHEGWVYGVHWHPPTTTSSGSRHQPMRLLTASMDKTMILWEPDSETGIWEEKLRVGEVGGNTLGLYGCQFSPDGKSILAHGYQGAFTLWTLEDIEGISKWTRGVVVGGHYSDVTDLSWEPDGQYLVTTSLDQTTRLYAPLRGCHWYEMGRPQVHGYDIQCLAMLGRFGFASGADEKVIRTFNAPMNVMKNLERLLDVDLSQEIALRQMGVNGDFAEGASVPALGLSNKAVYQGKTVNLHEDREIMPSVNEQYSDVAFRPINLSGPPSEDNLLQNTLWPETQKLYGHGFEIYALAANPQGTRLASACKASKAEYASIIIWNVTDWRQLAVLNCHSLTVVQMEFSASGDKLLSVSRDRTWALHYFDYQTGAITLMASTDKHTAVHSRIIWTCSWSPDDVYFVTGSRDKKIIIWSNPTAEGSDLDSSKPPLCGYEATASHTFQQPVTAVSYAPVVDVSQRYMIAVGLESGEILVCHWAKNHGFTMLCQLDTSQAHHLTVRRLRFRPKVGRAGGSNRGSDTSAVRTLQLASCGQDHLVRVYDIVISANTA